MFHLKALASLTVLCCIYEVWASNGESDSAGGDVGNYSTEGVVGSHGTEGDVGSYSTEGVADSYSTEGVAGSRSTEGVVGSHGTEEVFGSNSTAAGVFGGERSGVNETAVASEKGGEADVTSQGGGVEIEYTKLEPFVKEHIQDKALFPIEIKGLPEKQGDLLELVRKYLDKIGVLGVEEVSQAHRVGKKFQNILGPRVVVAAVPSVKVRDEIIRKGNANRLVSAADFDPASPSDRIYVNEFMSRDTKQLVYETKRFGRSIGYNRLWVRDGVVYLGNNMGGRVLSVSNFEELDELIESAQRS